MKKLLCKLANNYLKHNKDIACETLMELFEEKYGDKIFLIDLIQEARENDEDMLLSNGLVLCFSDWTISQIGE